MVTYIYNFPFLAIFKNIPIFISKKVKVKNMWYEDKNNPKIIPIKKPRERNPKFLKAKPIYITPIYKNASTNKKAGVDKSSIFFSKAFTGGLVTEKVIVSLLRFSPPIELNLNLSEGLEVVSIS